MNDARHSADTPRLSVVVPCFNEEGGLHELHRRVSAACHEAVGLQYELVLVNDGSRDGTWPAMLALSRGDARVVAVNLSRNFGHQMALSAGLKVCRGERVLILDADLQDPPELLSAMMGQIDAGYDVVYGRRRRREGETVLKKATAALFYRLFRRLVDVELPPDTGDFRLISRRALDLLNAMPEHHRFIRGMVSWIGLPQTPMMYDRAVRFTGETKYPLRKMIRFALDAITGFSIKPLRVASYLGIATGIGGAALIIYVTGAWMAGDAVPGWTSLMCITLVLGSIQLLVAGLMGEYLGRLYLESKQRPLFIIQDIVRGPSVPGAANERIVAETPAGP